jgi:SRSO17 transposase
VDDLFGRSEAREAVRQYLIGLLLPREHNTTIVEVAAMVPGARRQALQHVLHDAPWGSDALNHRRLALWPRALASRSGGRIPGCGHTTRAC